MSEPTRYQVVATPVDPHNPLEYLIECSACGLVGAVQAADPGPFVIAHIQNHTQEET